MSIVKIVGITLIAVAALGLAYGGFRASDTTEMQIGTIEMSVTGSRNLAVPMWAAIAAIVLGGALLLAPARKG